MRASTGLSSQPAAPPKEPAFKAGMHVVHPTWGGGIVIETRVMGSDETLTVVFDTVGLKKLAASLANLKISPK
jgi:DNA helicase-2/ATP-dependent DNA helicase PcrA